MSVPQPPIPLAGHCSALYNQTLYTYQWNAFQALELCPHGNWTSLTPGIAVNGSQCVLGKSDGQDALFVVGGTTTDPSAAGYPGLQRYLFKDKRWATSSPPEGKSIVQNRSMHGAAWLDASSAILVYAGGQDDRDELSSQTFTIAANAPYTMRSFTAKAPPAKRPLLVSWNATHAAMIGGQVSESKAVWLFGEATGWLKLDAELPQGVGDTSAVRAAVQRTGDGGAVVLETFDLGSSPSRVNALAVQAPQKRDLAGRELSAHSFTHRRPAHALSRRQSSGLPPYNNTFAPQTPRSDFALASDASGLIVVSGGQSSTSSDPQPLALFNGTGNAWLDPQQLFNPPAPPRTLTADPTSDAPISATQTATQSAAPPADGGGSGQPDARTVLGAVLGGLFGLGALIVLALLLLRHRRRRRRARVAEAQRRHEGLELDKEIDVDSPVAAAGHSRTSSFGNAGHLPGLDDGTRGHGRADEGWSRYFVNDAAAPAHHRPETDYTASDYDTASRPGSAWPSSSHARPTTQLQHPAFAGAGALARVPERRNSNRARTPPSPGSNPENYLHPRAHAAAGWDPIAGPATPSSGDRTTTTGSSGEAVVRPGDFPAVPGSSAASSVGGVGGGAGMSGRAARQWGLGNSWREGERGLRTLAGRELTGAERGAPGGAAGAGGRVGMGAPDERCTQFVPRPEAPWGGGAGGGSTRPEDMSWLNLGR